MSAMTTRAPSWTNVSAMARPIPLAPPVTMATFPASSPVMVVLPLPVAGPSRAGLPDAVDRAAPPLITSGCFQTSTAYDTISSECRSCSSRSASAGMSSSGKRSH